MWPLIWKDLRQCAQPLAIYLVFAMLLPLGALMVSRNFTAEGYLGMLFSLVVMGAPLLFAFWFIGEEKTKGTLRLLKILPIPESSIVGSKVWMSLILTTATLQIALIVIPALAPFAGGVTLVLDRAWWIWMNVAAIVCVGICSAVFIALEQKLAMQVAYFSMFALGGLTVMVAKSVEKAKGPYSELLQATLGSPAWAMAAGGVAILLLLVVIRFGANWIRRQDWSELLQS